MDLGPGKRIAQSDRMDQWAVPTARRSAYAHTMQKEVLN